MTVVVTVVVTVGVMVFVGVGVGVMVFVGVGVGVANRGGFIDTLQHFDKLVLGISTELNKLVRLNSLKL